MRVEPTKLKPKKYPATSTRKVKSMPNGEVKPGDLLTLYYFMRLAREFENSVLRLYQQGKIVGGAYSGNGNEATAVGSAFALQKEDYIFPMHRDVGAHFVKGQSVRNLMAQYLGKSNGLTRGRDGTGHYSDPQLRIYGNISHLGAMVPVATGVALAMKLQKKKHVVITYIGDGGSNVGEVHEALAMASVMRLPLILIIENNQYAYSTPIAKQFLVERLSDRAAGYGIPGVTIDGTDVLEVLHACRVGVERARAGNGPSIIESVTMRMHGHAAHDNAWYVPKNLVAEWAKKDPIGRFEHLLTEEGILTEKEKERMEGEIRESINEAISFAENSPDPAGEDASTGVFASE
jgi:TPP-dependent pyruvate/acetoin dehydrogenase alpha subunit